MLEKKSLFGASKINYIIAGGAKKYGIDEFLIIKKMLIKYNIKSILWRFINDIIYPTLIVFLDKCILP